MNEQLINYLMTTLPEKKQWVMDLEEQAQKENIPIMEPLGIHFLMQLIRISKPRRILEIGTAIGYSALRMIEADPTASIVTIERDKYRYEQAIKHIHQQGKDESISVMFGDALDIMTALTAENERFDFIFIDAAKGQYKRFFEQSIPLLNDNGLIISDNVLFKGFVAGIGNPNPRHIKMVNKIKEYNDWLVKHPSFTTSIIPIGDGVAISIKAFN